MTPSDPQEEKKSWQDYFNFRKQSVTGRIILVATILFFGTLIVFNFFTLAMGKWSQFGLYSIWISFGWLFLVVLTYVSAKLISMIMHRRDYEKQRLENERIPIEK